MEPRVGAGAQAISEYSAPRRAMKLAMCQPHEEQQLNAAFAAHQLPLDWHRIADQIEERAVGLDC
jgi:hypothetical protein